MALFGAAQSSSSAKRRLEENLLEAKVADFTFNEEEGANAKHDTGPDAAMAKRMALNFMVANKF
jgi:hypothetical protein